jgi:hypothetical protein
MKGLAPHWHVLQSSLQPETLHIGWGSPPQVSVALLVKLLELHDLEAANAAQSSALLLGYAGTSFTHIAQLHDFDSLPHPAMPPMITRSPTINAT